MRTHESKWKDLTFQQSCVVLEGMLEEHRKQETKMDAMVNEANTTEGPFMVAVAKLKEEFDLDLNKVPTRVYVEALRNGLKTFISRGLTGKDYSTTGLDGEDLEAVRNKIRARVQENIQAIYDDKVRIVGARKPKSGVPRAVMTEAVRMAKEQLKVLLRRNKIKVTQIKPSDLTKAAQAYLDQNPEILQKAKEAVEDRETAPAGQFDISALMAMAGDAPVSAKRAGFTTRRVEKRV